MRIAGVGCQRRSLPNRMPDLRSLNVGNEQILVCVCQVVEGGVESHSIYADKRMGIGAETLLLFGSDAKGLCVKLVTSLWRY